MEDRTFERVIDDTAERMSPVDRLANAINRFSKADIANEIRKSMEAGVSAGDILKLTDEEMRLVSAFRTFKTGVRKQGEVFTWQTGPVT